MRGRQAAHACVRSCVRSLSGLSIILVDASWFAVILMIFTCCVAYVAWRCGAAALASAGWGRSPVWPCLQRDLHPAYVRAKHDGTSHCDLYGDLYVCGEGAVSRAGLPLTHRRSTRQATFWAAALPPRMPRPRTQPLPLLPRPTPCNSRCVPSRRLWHRRSRRKPRVLRTAQHICSPSDGTISFCCTSNAAPVSPYPPNHQRMPQRITPMYLRTNCHQARSAAQQGRASQQRLPGTKNVRGPGYKCDDQKKTCTARHTAPVVER